MPTNPSASDGKQSSAIQVNNFIRFSQTSHGGDFPAFELICLKANLKPQQ